MASHSPTNLKFENTEESYTKVRLVYCFSCNYATSRPGLELLIVKLHFSDLLRFEFFSEFRGVIFSVISRY